MSCEVTAILPRRLLVTGTDPSPNVSFVTPGCCTPVSSTVVMTDSMLVEGDDTGDGEWAMLEAGLAVGVI